ncbi:MAG: cardiolipin synthase [bacterium]|nr:cardiolipin synthase [bacterium]
MTLSANFEIGAIIVAAIHMLGFFSAAEALYLTRTAQGAIAWGLSLVIFPYIAVPLYLVFGRSRFRGYKKLRIKFHKIYSTDLANHKKSFSQLRTPSLLEDHSVERTFEAISGTQFVSSNSIRLLIDGDEIFASIFEAIRRAENYVLIQFFIVRDDRIGKELRDCLIERAKAGVKIHFIYDEIGSKDLSHAYLQSLREFGIEIFPFETRQGWNNFFQFNFRNHRKILVVDGKVAFVGGLNVGDEYLRREKEFGEWRDTHVEIMGPALISIQSIFFSDWLWATGKQTTIDWKNAKKAGSVEILSIASGPADERETCALFFSEAIRVAKERIWISSPYFVPDEAVIRELQLAALRGVDVRLILPKKSDHFLVGLASLFYLCEISSFGVKVFQYYKGFLHQKVLLIDQNLAAVGTANLDNRSFRLNFEIMILASDQKFNSQVAEMLERDMTNCAQLKNMEFGEFPLWQRLSAKFARLFAPIL